LNPFESRVFQEMSEAINAIAADAVDDIYVLSLFTYDLDDDPRRPTAQLGYNTLEQVRDRTPDASGVDEATWNFAFYLQNQLLMLGEPGTPTGELLESLLKAEGIWYSDDDIEHDETRTYQLDPMITARFVAMMVRVVQELHASGLVARRFGRPIPVLVHELEYYDVIARQNELANPDGQADEFAAWIDRQYLA
jgi:hypothetical protein